MSDDLQLRVVLQLNEQLLDDQLLDDENDLEENPLRPLLELVRQSVDFVRV